VSVCASYSVSVEGNTGFVGFSDNPIAAFAWMHAATGPITGPSAAPKAAPVFSLKATKAEPMEIDDDSDKEISAMKLGMLSPSGDEDSDSAPILSPSHKKA